MHETGHNLDLAHSGQQNDDTTNVEYEDSTCTMGYTTGVDRAICFNGAKSVELGICTILSALLFPCFDQLNQNYTSQHKHKRLV